MAIKFEVNKWYQFKNKQAQEDFIKDHTENGIYARRLGMEPFRVTDIDYLGRPTKLVTSSGKLALSSGKDILDEDFIWLSTSEAEFFDEVENPYQAAEEQEEQEQIEDFTEFPIMKVTIESNEQAWSLYQMLKAHFKE
ncbi:goF mRNA metabolism modulator [Shigella phage Sf25]|uniref:GoF mRNA metabolism modulator n=1 Tax=Shigella phage Sf25 TaxID=2024310 RepID=A0A2K9VM21_9CAUD|nr:goF mRNA metabolism modulator [Shigella phage Sf25]